jgi:DNA-binding XRE family transcriptional regulator
VKFSDLKSAEQLLAEDLRDDPKFRAIWEETALARAVALRLVGYRIEHGLSQTKLAERLGMKQPAVARLEAGDQNPRWETLIRISERLGIEFQIEIRPKKRRRARGPDVPGHVQTSGGSVVVAAL